MKNKQFYAPNIQTWRKVLVGSDVHGAQRSPHAWKVFSEFAKDFKAAEVIALGDWGDFDWASSLPTESTLEAEEEYELINSLIDEVGVTVYLEGNHEERVTRYAGTVSPLIRSLLDVRKNLSLSKRGIKYIPYNGGGGVYRVGKMSMLHGFYTADLAAKPHAIAYGCCVFGHTHRVQTYSPKHAFVKTTGFNIGCLCNLRLPWCKTMGPNGWMNGFFYAYVRRNGQFSPYSARLVGGEYVIEGNVYPKEVK